MGETPFVLRLRTAAGHSRVVCSNSSTVKDLFSLVASQLQLPLDAFQLFKDAAKTQCLSSTCEDTLARSGFCSGDFVYVSSSETPRIPLSALTKPNGSCRDFDEKGPAIASESETPKTESEVRAAGDSNADARANAASSPTSQSAFVAAHNATSSSAEERQKATEETTAASNATGGSTGNGLGSFKAFDAFLKERDFAVHDLPLLNDFSPRELRAGAINRLPKSVTLKHQVYRHVDHLELMCVKEFQSFVSFWRNDLGGLQQRCGWMIGYYVEDENYEQGIRAVCEAIYEPPQEGDAQGFSLLETPNGDSLQKALAVAERLGLELIGFVFTHPERKELLTAKEVVFLARLQLQHLRRNHFSGYPVAKLVTCCLAPQKEEIIPNAFMVSDLMMALVRDGLIMEEQTDLLHVAVRPAKKGELLPQILEGGVETRSFDSSWAVVRVNESAPKKIRAFFKHSHFPRENRFIKPSPADIKAYFNNPLIRASRGEDSGNWRRFSDFHLLLFVATLFDVETSFAICDSVREEKPVEGDMEEVLSSLA